MKEITCGQTLYWKTTLPKKCVSVILRLKQNYVSNFLEEGTFRLSFNYLHVYIDKNSIQT